MFLIYIVNEGAHTIVVNRDFKIHNISYNIFYIGIVPVDNYLISDYVYLRFKEVPKFSNEFQTVLGKEINLPRNILNLRKVSIPHLSSSIRSLTSPEIPSKILGA